MVEANKKQAWIMFTLAGLCVISALAYIAWGNSRIGSSSQSSRRRRDEDEQSDSTPQESPYVSGSTFTTPIPETAVTSAPAITVAPTLPPLTGPVQVWPGGFLWNPVWHSPSYWNYRYPYTWDRYRGRGWHGGGGHGGGGRH